MVNRFSKSMSFCSYSFIFQKLNKMCRPLKNEDSGYHGNNHGFTFGLKSLYHSLKHAHNPFYRQTTPLFNGNCVIDLENNDTSHPTHDVISDKEHPGHSVNNVTYSCCNSAENNTNGAILNCDSYKHRPSTEMVCPMVRVVSDKNQTSHTLGDFTDLQGDVISRPDDTTTLQTNRQPKGEPPKYEECV